MIDVDERHGLGRNEGAYFGLWTLVTKLNLALAAGIALPMLALLGYTPNASNSAQALAGRRWRRLKQAGGAAIAIPAISSNSRAGTTPIPGPTAGLIMPSIRSCSRRSRYGCC